MGGSKNGQDACSLKFQHARVHARFLRFTTSFPEPLPWPKERSWEQAYPIHVFLQCSADLPILFPSFPMRGVAIRYAPVEGRKMTPVNQETSAVSKLIGEMMAI